MPLIYFLRHGQTDWNVARRMQGNINIPLNDTGRKQALRNGYVLNEVIPDKQTFRYISSPLLRACETMQIIRNTMGLEPKGYETDKRIREISMGNWEGMTYPEIELSDADNLQKREADHWNVAPPHGESYYELSLRILEWLSTITTDTVAVSHGGVSRVLRGHFLKLSMDEMLSLDVPQDKVLMIDGDQLNWI